MKILLIAGHGDGDSGAVGNGYKECSLARNFCTELIFENDAFSENLEITLYPTEKNCYEESKNGNIPDYSIYDYTIEVHFNSFSDTSAHGSEILIHPDQKVTFETQFLENIEKLGFRKRGIKLRDDLLNLNNARSEQANYCLLEICFISSKADMERYIATKKIIVQKLLESIVDFFELSDNRFYRVQVGAFKNKQNAINYKKEFSEKYGIDCFVVEVK